MQSTLYTPAKFIGTGLHSGRPVRMTVRPAEIDCGIRFRRTDLAAGDNIIPARWDLVEPSRLCTKLTNTSGVSVSTVEHIMAALAGLGIQNALVDIDGPEVPILDGSAAPFVAGLLACGIRAQDAPLTALEIRKPVEVREGPALARLDPAPGFEIDYVIDFEEAAIGHQERHLDMRNAAFVRVLCNSRTFCLQSDVDALRASGLALGGTLENAVVFEDGRVLSPGGLRHIDEPVRHKMLDAIGDLGLAGGPILGRYTGVRAGHAMTNKLLRALFADSTAYAWVDCDPETELVLPGVGVSNYDLALTA